MYVHVQPTIPCNGVVSVHLYESSREVTYKSYVSAQTPFTYMMSIESLHHDEYTLITRSTSTNDTSIPEWIRDNDACDSTNISIRAFESDPSLIVYRDLEFHRNYLNIMSIICACDNRLNELYDIGVANYVGDFKSDFYSTQRAIANGRNVSYDRVNIEPLLEEFNRVCMRIEECRNRTLFFIHEENTYSN